MKLIIQIPCFNEEDMLPLTVGQLPRHLDGVDQIEFLVIDDGSSDRTAEIAQQIGVDHVVRHIRNKGLASAFQTGLDACLQLNADIIVNTDADNQYPAEYIPALIKPILEGRADMVIGNRQVTQVEHFSPTKKLLQRVGSAVVRYISQTEVPDAPSGFRALSRQAALQLNVITGYTYTLETIIQAGAKNLTVSHIAIHTNAKTRESRLISSSTQYVLRSTATILRLFLLYKPLQTLTYLSLPFWLVGAILWLRFFVFLILGETSRGSNVQSVLVGSVALLIGFLIVVLGLLGDLIAVNRRLQEQTLYYLKRSMFGGSVPKAGDDEPIEVWNRAEITHEAVDTQEAAAIVAD